MQGEGTAAAPWEVASFDAANNGRPSAKFRIKNSAGFDNGDVRIVSVGWSRDPDGTVFQERTTAHTNDDSEKDNVQDDNLEFVLTNGCTDAASADTECLIVPDAGSHCTNADFGDNLCATDIVGEDRVVRFTATPLSPGRYVIAVAITNDADETVTVEIHAKVEDPTFIETLDAFAYGGSGDGRVGSPYQADESFNGRIQVVASNPVTNRTLNRVLRVDYTSDTTSNNPVYETQLNISDGRPHFVFTTACDSTSELCAWTRSGGGFLTTGRYRVILFITRTDNNTAGRLVVAYFRVQT